MMPEHKPLFLRLKQIALFMAFVLAVVSERAAAETADPIVVPATLMASACDRQPLDKLCDISEGHAEPREALTARVAPAEDAAPPTQSRADVTSELTYLSFNVVRLNPLGLQTQFDLDWKTRLYDPGDSLIQSNNFFSIGLSPVLSPALARLGVSAKFQPLAILKLEARWDYLAYFGNINILQSFQDADAEFSDTELSRRGDAGQNYATDGWSLTLDGEARAKVGPVIVRNRFRAIYVDVALRHDDRVFYDQYFDLLLPRHGWFFTNDADLLFEVTPKLIVGLRWAFMGVNYNADNFATSLEQQTNAAPIHRLGPLIAYTFHDEPGAGFNKPTLFALIGWHLKHPSRTGQDVSQAIPYIALGFAFSGRVLP